MARFGPEFHDPIYPCPDCDREFDTEKGRDVHRGIVHPEEAREIATCKYCGDEFEVPPHEAEERKFCSVGCYSMAARKRVTIECAHCDGEFELPPNEADKRKFCSVDCRYAAQVNQDRRVCAACGTGFSVNAAREDRHCSLACRSEAANSSPRPDDIDGLLWLLYVYEGHNARDTRRRANANLDPDDRLTETDVRERLHANSWMENGSMAKYGHLSVEDVGLGDDSTADQHTTGPASDGGWSA